MDVNNINDQFEFHSIFLKPSLREMGKAIIHIQINFLCNM
jgi:hypothetical protein